jgi:mono/diheme cytochrome c family protein
VKPARGGLAQASARSALLTGLLVLSAGPSRADDPWVAPAADQAKVNPLSSSKDSVKRGRALFSKHCATCHGKEGKGDGPAAAFGMITPRDLTSPTVQARLTDGELFWKLSKGRKVGSDVLMPAFEDKISSEEDRWKVVLFVRSLLPTQ